MDRPALVAPRHHTIDGSEAAAPILPMVTPLPVAHERVTKGGDVVLTAVGFGDLPPWQPR